MTLDWIPQPSASPVESGYFLHLHAALTYGRQAFVAIGFSIFFHPQREASFPLGTAAGNLASSNVVEFPPFAGGVSTRTIKMRRGLVVFLVINLVVIAFLVRSVFTLLTLLIEDGSADAIHSAEIPAPNSPLIDNLPQLIPKLIHQTYVNETIPEHWREAQRSCIDLHEDYEYKVGRSGER